VNTFRASVTPIELTTWRATLIFAALAIGFVAARYVDRAMKLA
jgi:hypothetical protein